MRKVLLQINHQMLSGGGGGALVASHETRHEKHGNVLQVIRNWWMVGRIRMRLANLHLNSFEARVYDDVIFYCGGRTLLFEGNQGVLKRLCYQFEIEIAMQSFD